MQKISGKTKKTIASENFVHVELNMFRGEVDKRFDQAEFKAEKRYNKVIEHLDKIAGQFEKFDEEREILAFRQSIHSDKIEKIENAVFKTS